MTNVTTFLAGNATGKLIEGVVHVLKRSSSRYHLKGPGGFLGQYVCQDGCCDRGVGPDVHSVVLQAKEAGATKVVLRTGQRGYYASEICGLPTHDVSGKRGVIAEGWEIISAW